MARQIIVLETVKASDGVVAVNVVQWFPIAAATNRTPRPGAVSRAASAITVLPAEQASLEDGSVREEFINVGYPASMTTAAIKADLQKRYTDRATAIAAEPPIRQFYGVTFDGTAWSA